VLFLLFGVLAIYWELHLFYACFSDYSLLYVCKTNYVKTIFLQVLKHNTVSGNKIKIVPEAVLHTVCAICGVLPLIIFHEDGDVYQLILQIVLYPMFCYIVSIICILTLKHHSSIVFSALILLTLFYR